VQTCPLEEEKEGREMGTHVQTCSLEEEKGKRWRQGCSGHVAVELSSSAIESSTGDAKSSLFAVESTGHAAESSSNCALVPSNRVMPPSNWSEEQATAHQQVWWETEATRGGADGCDAPARHSWHEKERCMRGTGEIHTRERREAEGEIRCFGKGREN
jgi:hypothetical protein